MEILKNFFTGHKKGEKSKNTSKTLIIEEDENDDEEMINKYHDLEEIFHKRQELETRHGVLLGCGGSGKSWATQKEITFILDNTDDDVIVFDTDGSYSKFCEKYGGYNVKIAEDATFLEKDEDIPNRLIVVNLCDLDDSVSLKVKFVSVDWAVKRAKESPEKTTWIFLENFDEILFTESFLSTIENVNNKNVVITAISSNPAMLTEDKSSRRLFLNIRYIHLFRQSVYVRDGLVDFFPIEPYMIKYLHLGETLAVIDGKPLKVQEFIDIV